MKLWLDDNRPVPDGWLRCTQAGAVVCLLLQESFSGDRRIDELSLDHDLGAGEPTGYDLLHVMHRLKLTVPRIIVHSMRLDAKASLEDLIQNFELETL